MNTPICDFVENYVNKDVVRLHMPGHKGKTFLGIEPYDITEINGADSLFKANGIIKKSEKNASKIFGADTYYSTEGSSLCIRTMVYLALQKATQLGVAPVILAGRNAHKSFVNACALLGATVNWLYPENCDNYLSCTVSAESVEKEIVKNKPVAVYITSPDYLGNILDIKSIADVCNKYGVLLLVDNAHGSYLKFLKPSLHPIDLGADMCSDSAHKTLVSLTGGAYLHVKKGLELFVNVKSAMSLFASTSPSYLTLASLDYNNLELSSSFSVRLRGVVKKIERLKSKLIKHGYTLLGNEPLKVTIKTKDFGWRGELFAEYLRLFGIECEYFDHDVLVLMFSIYNDEEDYSKIENALLSLKKGKALKRTAPKFFIREKVMEIRDAVMAKKKTVRVEDALGKVLSLDCVSCPPAVPIVVCGEKIDANAIECFKYYGISKVTVVD